MMAAMAADEPDDNNNNNNGNLNELILKEIAIALKKFVSSFGISITTRLVESILKLAVCAQKEHGDYQWNGAMSIWAIIKDMGAEFRGPRYIAEAIMQNLPPSEIIESCSVTGPGFLNIRLSTQWMDQDLKKMLTDGIEIRAPKLPVKTAVVDFSSPNIAKEMHVGHLRSTIIGDTIARMLEFCNVDVLRRNHVGDWGTQFGMLIAFLFENFPNGEVSDQAIGDLQVFYKASKKKFDEDDEFKERAQQAVVSLQGGEEKHKKAWAQICEISRNSFEKIYQRLGVHLEEKGESFYNPYIPKTLDLLRKKGLIEENKGAQVIFIEGKKIPLIVVKRDGGFNYASTDLAALWYRIHEEKADWIIYVTDAGQREHFEMFFAAAELAGWLPTDESKYPKTSHVKFGNVLGDDGKKFRTRSTEVVKLVDLLDEAKARCKAAFVKKVEKMDPVKAAEWTAEWTAEEIEHTAETIGYGAVKYADLKNNRETNYTFNFDQMLNDKGNTAVYLLYAHARICSIIKKSGKDMDELKKLGELKLEKDEERELGLHLLRFAEVVESACTNLMPHVLCDYLYTLSEKFNVFCFKHRVLGVIEETSRLLLCEATAVVMRKCFHLLGITPVYKI